MIGLRSKLICSYKLYSGAHQEHNTEDVRTLVENMLKLNLDPLGRSGCKY